MSLNTMERSPSPSSDELPRGVEAPFVQDGDGPRDGQVEGTDVAPDNWDQKTEHDMTNAELYQKKMAEFLATAALNDTMEDGETEE